MKRSPVLLRNVKMSLLNADDRVQERIGSSETDCAQRKLRLSQIRANLSIRCDLQTKHSG